MEPAALTIAGCILSFIVGLMMRPEPPPCPRCESVELFGDEEPTEKHGDAG